MNCLKSATGTCVTDTSEKAWDLANSLPSLSITSPSNILHLTELDADLNMPLDNNFGSIVRIIFIVIMTSPSVY